MASEDLLKAYEMGRQSTMSMPASERKRMTVKEIETLAKAGVAVDLDSVDLREEHQVHFQENPTLMQPLIHRLRLAFPMMDYSRDQRFSYIAAASCPQGPSLLCEKVAVFVVTVHGNAAVLEDDIKNYPSDALIAKLHLLVETEEKTHVQNKGQFGAQVNPVQQSVQRTRFA